MIKRCEFSSFVNFVTFHQNRAKVAKVFFIKLKACFYDEKLFYVKKKVVTL